MTENVQPAPSGGEISLPDALCRVAKRLVLDLRALGFRDEPEGYHELAKAERRAVQSLLDSDDPRLVERGLQALHAIESERRKLAELELSHAKAGMEALVVHHLGRLRLQPEAGDQGLSPEKASMLITQIVGGLAGKGKTGDPCPSPEAEPVAQPPNEPNS